MADFCTLFDSRFLSRGLALHASLQRFGGHQLYILPMDDAALKILQQIALPRVILVPMADFEVEALRHIRPLRSAGEYCWTCTSHLIAYCLRRFGLDACTYIDADLWFFHNPQVLVDEMGTDAVLLTEHRYSPGCGQTDISGHYCVQFMTFRNDARGIRALTWWQERCLEWCYARAEDGKFGDQKYLDDWTERFEGVHVLNHLGGGVAPWNVAQYELKEQGGELMVSEGSGVRYSPMVFYHFHALKLFTNGQASLCGGDSRYRLNRTARKLIYKPYIKELCRIGSELRERFPRLDPHGLKDRSRIGGLGMARRLALRCVGRYDIVGVANLTQTENRDAFHKRGYDR